jgi:hypothetical protein
MQSHPLSRILCTLCIVLPTGALADPVTVITRASGIDTFYGATVLEMLGIPVADNMPQPFSLTISTTFDTDQFNPAGDHTAVTNPSSVVAIDFEVAAQHYRYTGNGVASAYIQLNQFGRDYYTQSVFFGNTVQFHQYFYGAPGSIATDTPLAPYAIDTNAALTSQIGVDVYPSNPDAPGYWSIGAAASTYSLRVISAVPEPAPFIMFSLGMLVLGCWRRRRGMRGFNDRPAAPTPAPTPTC